MNCLRVFDHFVGLVLKGLKYYSCLPTEGKQTRHKYMKESIRLTNYQTENIWKQNFSFRETLETVHRMMTFSPLNKISAI